jgi:hypothetical protein
MEKTNKNVGSRPGHTHTHTHTHAQHIHFFSTRSQCTHSLILSPRALPLSSPRPRRQNVCGLGVLRHLPAGRLRLAARALVDLPFDFQKHNTQGGQGDHGGAAAGAQGRAEFGAEVVGHAERAPADEAGPRAGPGASPLVGDEWRERGGRGGEGTSEGAWQACDKETRRAWPWARPWRHPESRVVDERRRPWARRARRRPARVAARRRRKGKKPRPQKKQPPPYTHPRPRTTGPRSRSRAAPSDRRPTPKTCESFRFGV